MGIINSTPWWVYLLFFYLILLGLRALKPRTISVVRLILIPAILTLWNIAFLAERLSDNFFFLIFWGVGLGIGALMGWHMVYNWHVKTDKKNRTVTLPPTVSTLLLILIIFATRYFFLFHYELYPEFYSHYFMSDALSSGVITGIFIGRSIELYRKYREG